MNKLSFSNNELEVMNLMWREGRSLSRADIIELTPDRSWSKSSIHILLNSLLEKGAIEVDGFVRTNKNYGRTYSPCITQNEYAVSAVTSSSSPFGKLFNSSSIPAVFAALIEDKDIDEEVLDKLDKMIEDRRKELKS